MSEHHSIITVLRGKRLSGREINRNEVRLQQGAKGVYADRNHGRDGSVGGAGSDCSP